ncbi:MAG: metallopeptidase family protein [Actinomycetia bacterium]|nr:metallopeptidase family protein [Actinomycetes bacterium]
MITPPTEAEFDDLIARAIGQLSREGIEGLENVAITSADAPTPDQLQKLQMRGDQLLLGLYEGVPLTKRGIHYNFALPDKITLFRLALAHVATDEGDLFKRIRHTLWHEVAHYYGLDHPAIYALEKRSPQENQ